MLLIFCTNLVYMLACEKAGMVLVSMHNLHILSKVLFVAGRTKFLWSIHQRYE